jgi:hypothetical protein
MEVVDDNVQHVRRYRVKRAPAQGSFRNSRAAKRESA